MHSCPHCGLKTISTFQKLMPGWNPRCKECGGRWRLSYFVVFFIFLMPFFVVPIMLLMASSGMGIRMPAVISSVLIFLAVAFLYWIPLVRK